MSLDDEIFDDGRIPPEDPPVKKGGLNWWQKAVIGVSIPIILTAGYFGINALVNRQYKPVSTPTPVATSTYTPQPTPTITQVPTQTPTATPIPGLENILSEDEVLDYVASFQPNQEVTKEVLGRIDAINKTYYFGFTRNTFESGKFVTKFLTVKEYMALWNQPGGTLPNSLGSTAKLPNGETVIYINVDAAYVKEDGPLSILLNTVRETANAEAERRSLRNYELGIKDVKAFRKEVSEKYNLGDISDLNLPWIERESLLSLYLAAVVHKLDELGVSMGTPTSPEIINSVIDIIASETTGNSSPGNDPYYRIMYSQATFLAWKMAFNRADTAKALQENGSVSSQQAYSLFDEAITKSQTREGLEQRVAEVVTAVRNAHQYTQQIKDASVLSKRNLRDVYYP